MRRLFQAIAAVLVMALPGYGDDMPVVVELYTSQGCSSCPPADEMMHELASRDDVIALSLHVDYWDYIGWKDEFADPYNAKRQRGYAMAAGRRTVYTPEMIVNGMTDIVGAKPMKLAMAIEHHKKDRPVVDLSVARVAEKIAINATPLDTGVGPVLVQMLRYQPARVAKISRGENAGRTIQYVNVAQDWQTLGTWEGNSALTLEVDAPGDWPVVVLMQQTNYGPIVAARRVD